MHKHIHIYITCICVPTLRLVRKYSHYRRKGRLLWHVLQSWALEIRELETSFLAVWLI